jgi:ferritin-like protein
MKDSSDAALRIVPDGVEYTDTPTTSGQLALVLDKLAGIERRLDSFVVEVREAIKDMTTVIRVHHGRGLDTEERVGQLERDLVKHRGQIVKLEQAAAKRLKGKK